MPIIVVNGTEEGPTLVVDACHHGNEYEGIEGVIRVAQALDAKHMKGTFIGVPVLNVPAFEARTRVNPYDYEYLDMNRSYPCRERSREGCIPTHLTATERISQLYFNEVVCKADYVVSCHGGGNYQLEFPYVYYQASDVGANQDIGKKSMELAKVFGLPILTKWLTGWSGSLLHAAAQKNIPAILSEIGGVDRYYLRENSAKLHVRGITNVMKHLDMLDGRIELPKEQIVVEMPHYSNKYGGLWRPEAELGKNVPKGGTIGRVLDLFGNQIECVKSPVEGLLTMIWGYPIVHPGEELYSIGIPVAHAQALCSN